MTRARDVANIDTILTTKGDIYAASAAYTPARLAAGADGSTLLADSAATTGLRWDAKQQAGRNLLLNSDFSIWQRGTSFTGALPYYGADRWQFYRASAAADATWTRQSASLDGFDYCVRAQRNSGTTGTYYIRVGTSFETTQVKSLWGKTLTLSFYARAGANISSSGSAVQVIIHGGTGTDGSLAGGFTSRTSLISSAVTITSTWARYSVSISALSNTYTQLGVSIELQPTGTAGANDYFELTGVQLEVGNSVTPFLTATGTLAGELAACQRYYWRNSANNSNNYLYMGNGFGASTTQAKIVVQHPVPMRVKPSSIDYANISVRDGLNNTATTSLTDDVANAFASSINANTASGLTQYRPYSLFVENNSGGYIGFSAEL